MNRCPHCNHAIAICLCVSIVADASVSNAQDWCSLPAATSERAVSEAAKPDAEFPEAATTLPGMRQLSPDQLLPERALRDGFLQKAQFAVFVGVCAASLAMCLPRAPLPPGTLACGIFEDTLSHIENRDMPSLGDLKYVLNQTVTPTILNVEPELGERWRVEHKLGVQWRAPRPC
jgi:hypothetical protein